MSTRVRTLISKAWIEGIDYVRACRFARVLRGELGNAAPDSFTDTRFYPPADADVETALRYFLVMVAIDHRTSRYGPFEGYVDGEFFHGADLLYRLGAKKLSEDPEFFSPERLANVSVDMVRDWLSVDGNTIWDPETRAALLRDLGSKLLKMFEGSASCLVKSAGNYLKRPFGHGLIDVLKAFKAYSDPVEKKSYLLAKFISRRGYFRYVDVENSEVPVDNHLVRIAFRVGLVRIGKGLMKAIMGRDEVSEDVDISIRLAVRRAYKLVARACGIDPLIFDDYLWMFGRKYCTRMRPLCVRGGVSEDSCPFASICLFSGRKSLMMTEHSFQNTYYY